MGAANASLDCDVCVVCLLRSRSYMLVGISIFQEFNLPNSTTWFYFSLLLAIALFFRFTRLLSVRNLDVVGLFLLVPGLLLLLEAQTRSRSAHVAMPGHVAHLVAESAVVQMVPGVGLGNAVTLATSVQQAADSSARLAWYGYLWLMCGSACFFLRCLLDLALVSRPALGPNLNPSGLIFLSLALFVCLIVVAYRKPTGPPGPVGKPSVAVHETQRRADYLVQTHFLIPGLVTDNTQAIVEATSAVMCHFLIVVALAFIGWRHFQDSPGGVAAAAFYLLLPYTAYHVDQVHHVLPTALLLWAVALYRLPMLAGIFLGLSAWLSAGSGYSSVFLLFPWFGFYWRRRGGRFLFGFLASALTCGLIIAALLWADDNLAASIQSSLSLSDWQPWLQPNPEVTKGFWTGVALAPAYRLPVFVAFVAFVLATTFWPKPKNLAQLIALSAAILIGIQFWFADQGGVYVLGYLPLLLLMVFRPNCSDKLAPLPTTKTDWMARSVRFIRGKLLNRIRPPEPSTQLH
jgi:hypothetical protein